MHVIRHEVLLDKMGQTAVMAVGVNIIFTGVLLTS